MNRKEYIEKLRFYLEGLPKNEIEDIIYDYEEHFQVGLSRGKTEEEISEELGNPKNIAKMFKTSSKINDAEKNPSSKNLFKAIFSAMALGFFNFIIVLGPFVAIIAILIAIYSISLAFIVGGIKILFNNVTIYPTTSISFGIGLSSLGILVFIGSVYSTKFIYKITVKYLKWNIDTITK